MTQRIRKTHGSGAQRGHECVEKDVGNIAAAAVARRQARRGQGPGSGLVGRGPEVILGRCDSDGREQRRRRAVGEEVALGVLIVTARPPVSHGRQRQGVHELPGGTHAVLRQRARAGVRFVANLHGALVKTRDIGLGAAAS